MPRSVGLDALRVGALILVLFAHGCAFWFPRFTETLAFPARVLSFIGIEIFFVLSGFLIARALFKIMETRQGVFNFWTRRALRTLPAYYLFLLINFVVMGWVLNRPTGDTSYFWFGQNLTSPMQVFFYPESWSLALEVWFYLLAPCLMWVLPNWRSRAGLIASIGIALVLLVVFAALRMRAALDGASWDEGLRKVVLLRLDALIFGVIAGGIAIRCPELFHNVRKPAASLAALLLAVLIYWTLRNQTAPDVIFRSLSFSLCGLSAMLLLPYCAHWQGVRNSTNSWITQLSRWAYAIYLTHLLVLFVVLHYTGAWLANSVWCMGAVTMLWLSVSVALAALVYRWIEKPLMDLAPSIR